MIPVQLCTNAIIDALRAQGLRIGDHELPTDRTLPYSILYLVDDAPVPTGPPLTDPQADTWIGVQVTSVGSGRKQAQWQADKVRGFFLDRADSGAFTHGLPAIPGYRWVDRLGTTPSGVAPEGTAPNTLYNVPDRYTLHVTPAS